MKIKKYLNFISESMFDNACDIHKKPGLGCVYDKLPENIKPIFKEVHENEYYIVMDGSYKRGFNHLVRIFKYDESTYTGMNYVNFDDVMKYIPKIFNDLKNIGDDVRISFAFNTFDPFDERAKPIILKELPIENPIDGDINHILIWSNYTKYKEMQDQQHKEMMDDIDSKKGDMSRDEYMTKSVFGALSGLKISNKEEFDKSKNRELDKFDYSKMNQSELQKAMDVALDEKNFELAKRIGKYIKKII